MGRRNTLEPLSSSKRRESLHGLRASLQEAEAHRDLLFDLNDCADFHGKTVEEASHFMKAGAQSMIPRFSTQEVLVGDLLAKGGYNRIYSLDAILLKEDKRLCSAAHLRRLAFATIVKNGTTRNQNHYVVKFLEPDLKLKRLRRGALDLVREAKMLANMQHKNIISLHGMAEERGAGFSEGTTGFFLILDRLEETLLQRINRWEVAHRTTPLQRIFKRKRTSVGTATALEEAKSSFCERFQALVDLASPLVYLHSKLNVVYRDLKPENIGFSQHDGTLKLFDFGLAKELNGCQRLSATSTLYHVGSFGGTHPYLAPEVAMARPYGLSADTYSFSIVCFEVLTMREPFEDLMEHEYANKVVQGDKRPKFPTKSPNCWSPALKELMSQCWDADPTVRPHMEEVLRRLQAIQLSLTT